MVAAKQIIAKSAAKEATKVQAVASKKLKEVLSAKKILASKTKEEKSCTKDIILTKKADAVAAAAAIEVK
jgi:hypothetical protein